MNNLRHVRITRTVDVDGAALSADTRFDGVLGLDFDKDGVIVGISLQGDLIPRKLREGVIDRDTGDSSALRKIVLLYEGDATSINLAESLDDTLGRHAKQIVCRLFSGPQWLQGGCGH
jgi:hypothetical protein